MKNLSFNFGKLSKLGKPAVPESPTFYLASDNGVRQLTRFGVGAIGKGKTKSNITLMPMRSVSQETFTFPFASTTKVQTALRLKVMPWAAAGEFEIFPVVTNRVGRGVTGIAWYVSPSEFEHLDASVSNSEGMAGAKGLVWPAALPLVSAVDGTGVTVFADRENFCAILWQNYIPVLSQWRPRTSLPSSTAPDAAPNTAFSAITGANTEADNINTSDAALTRLITFFDRYCTDQNLPRGETYVLDVANSARLATIGEELENIAKASIERCPWLMNVNLSRSALEGARDLERMVTFMTKAACWIFLMGALVLAGSILRWREAQNATTRVRAQSENLYREVFEPGRTAKISNPVTLARDKLAGIQGTQTTGRSLGVVLADMGSVFTENPSMDIAIDILRYNTEGIDCTGLAPDMSTVLAFRKAWEERAAQSQLANTQSVSNAGYRFDLRIKWQN